MSFKDRNSWMKPDRDDDGRTSAEPHADAQKNFEYCLMALKKIDVLENSLEISYSNMNAEGVVFDPIMVMFSWWEDGKKYTGNRNFHINLNKFREEMDNAIKFLLRRGFVKNKEIPMNRAQAQQQNKNSSLFAGTW